MALFLFFGKGFVNFQCQTMQAIIEESVKKFFYKLMNNGHFVQMIVIMSYDSAGGLYGREKMKFLKFIKCFYKGGNHYGRNIKFCQ